MLGGGARRPMAERACTGARDERGSSSSRSGAVVVVFAAVLVGRAALAHRYVDEGRELLASDPAAALDKAR